MRKFGFALALLGLVALAATPSFAGEVYIDAAALSAGVTGNSATSVSNAATATTQSFITWQFSTGGNQSAFGHFWFPADNAGTGFQPSISWRAQNTSTAQNVYWTVGMTASNSAAQGIYANITGIEAGSINTGGLPVITGLIPTVAGGIRVSTAASAYDVAVGSSGFACGTCQNLPVVFRITRLSTSNYLCTASTVPWACCTGPATGTCAPSNDGGWAEVIGIRFHY